MFHLSKIVLSIIFFITLITGCIPQEKLEGYWAMELELQGNKVPYLLEFKKEKVLLHNSVEKRTLLYEIQSNNEIIIPILGFDAALKLKKTGNSLRGYWIKFNRNPEYKLPTMGMKLQKKPEMSFDNLDKIPRKWKFTFENKKDSDLLFFTENNRKLYGSIITQTGDYRYLTPVLKNDKLELYGFDGAYSFYIEADLSNDNKSLSGTLYSGLSYNKKFKAIASKEFKLKDPTQITSYKDDITKLSFKTLDGEAYNIKDQLGKVQVIQIFGSWCPNCIDETQFIKEWKGYNKDLDIKFSLIAFERSPNKKHALKQLKKAKSNYKIDYPILIGGYTKEDKVKTILPGLESFISFPTTIYIDKKGKVRKILASFQGPATGKFFDQFSKDFDLFLKKLASE